MLATTILPIRPVVVHVDAGLARHFTAGSHIALAMGPEERIGKSGLLKERSGVGGVGQHADGFRSQLLLRSVWVLWRQHLRHPLQRRVEKFAVKDVEPAREVDYPVVQAPDVNPALCPRLGFPLSGRGWIRFDDEFVEKVEGRCPAQLRLLRVPAIRDLPGHVDRQLGALRGRLAGATRLDSQLDDCTPETRMAVLEVEGVCQLGGRSGL